jgi:hypothetical protein
MEQMLFGFCGSDRLLFQRAYFSPKDKMTICIAKGKGNWQEPRTVPGI